MSALQAYARALREGHHRIALRLEQQYDLDGYPPELVSVGLKAVDEGRDPIEAVEDYIAGEQQ